VLTEEARSEPDLRDYARVVWRRKWTVATSMAVVLCVALVFSYSQTPKYAATAKVLLRTRPTASLFGSAAQPVDPARSVQTEIEVIKTEPVRELVRQKIGDAPPVSVSSVGQTDLITIRAESASARRAPAVANAYANAYIEFRRKQNIDELLASSHEIESKISDLQKQIDEIGAQVDAQPPCVDARTTPTPCSLRDSGTQRRTTLLTQQASFRQRLDQLQVDQAVANGGAQLVTPASTPLVAFAPTPRRTAVVAAILGLLCGVALAFLFEYVDDSIKSKEDFERAVPGLGVLGMIPLVPDWRSREDSRLVSITSPTSPTAEAYRILRTSIQFTGIERQVRIIQVTSASAQEGKTTTLANLAVAFASFGVRTVAVCCDLRRPRLHQFFGLDNAIGFTSVLLGSVSLSKALQPVPGQDRLLVLASGPLPPNPAELLSSSRTGDLLRNLATQADVVLIDSPPVLPVTDSLVLSQRVDSTVLVSSAGITTRKAAARAVEMLQQVEAPVVGAVLNGVAEDSGYGGYASRYYTADAVPFNGARSPNGNGAAGKSGRWGRKRAKRAS
jgi:capsular exopolysaccharide synthesis family protein